MHPKKSLGQNFLRSKVIVARIASAGKISLGEFVLEIGPGKGILTKALLEAGAKVIAVEKDYELVGFLKEKFSKEISEGNFFLLSGDILEFSALDIFSHFKLKTTNYKLVANIPYYITGEILRKFLEEKNQPDAMILLVQKEVGRRIVASDKKESILSLSVKAYGYPIYIETVKKNMFSPAPKVDSAVIRIENISKEKFQQNNVDEKKFFEVVKAGFAHKRKKLSGNLKNIIAKENIANFKDKRAEDLSLLDWFLLSKNI